uniref:Uncharacterized protein n=1 Tax=Amphimedon queenslandica TaxID=400682 RepID=A0A1X7USF8_AMPQE
LLLLLLLIFLQDKQDRETDTIY